MPTPDKGLPIADLTYFNGLASKRKGLAHGPQDLDPHLIGSKATGLGMIEYFAANDQQIFSFPERNWRLSIALAGWGQKTDFVCLAAKRVSSSAIRYIHIAYVYIVDRPERSWYSTADHTSPKANHLQGI